MALARAAHPAGRQPRPPSHALALLVACLALGTLAALPRLGDVLLPITTDESLWTQRTSRFATAVLDGDAAGTYQTGHPGVTTMWIAGLAMGLENARDLGGERLALLDPDGRAAFTAARRAMALVESALLVIAALLVARAFGALAGVLAGLLLALEPWLVALSRVVHLDALLSSLLLVVLLACVVRWQRAGGWGFVLLAGAAAGLAALTKSSALALLPVMLLPLAIASAWREAPAGRRRIVLDLVALGAVSALVALLVWPTLRADPLGTTLQVVRFGMQEGGQPHELGSFFFGQPVLDPGPLFYPVVLAFRLSPLAVLGVLAWLVGLVALAPRTGRRDRGATAWLLLCALLVLVVMGAGPKKLDRYALPAVPLLVVVAAVGYRNVLGALSRRPVAPLLVGAIGLVQLALCAGARPYFFSYYSPLLGGAVAAERVLPIGWGEGTDRLAAYLNQHSGKPARSVLAPAAIRVALRTQTRARVVDPNERTDADYLATYVSAEQRHLGLPIPPQARLVLDVRIDGTDYARLYALR